MELVPRREQYTVDDIEGDTSGVIAVSKREYEARGDFESKMRIALVSEKKPYHCTPALVAHDRRRRHASYRPLDRHGSDLILDPSTNQMHARPWAAMASKSNSISDHVRTSIVAQRLGSMRFRFDRPGGQHRTQSLR